MNICFHAKSGFDFIFTAVICDIYFDLGLMLIFKTNVYVAAKYLVAKIVQK